MFTPSDPKITMPFIGDICYDSVYKTNIISKINNFNNSFQHRLVDFNQFITDINPINKSIDLIAKNKALVVYEKIYGKVKQTSMQLFYTDRTLLCEAHVKNIGNYVTHHVFNKHLVIAFRRSKKDLVVQLYEIKGLHVIKTLPIDYEITRLLLSDELVYLISEKKPFINVYDLELNYKNSFGQITSPDKQFYIKDDLITIQSEKMYLKSQEKVSIIDINNGEVISSIKFPDVPNLKTVTICVDFNKEKYLVYNGFNKLSYYNSKGEKLVDNKLRQNSRLNFEMFQYSKSGHFGFINMDKNIILIV